MDGRDRVFDSEPNIDNNERGIKYEIEHVENTDSALSFDAFDHSAHPYLALKCSLRLPSS